jgi:hypothetical protein
MDCAAMSILVMLALIEMINRQPPSKSHPSAQDRIAPLLDVEDSESMNLFLHLQAMLGVCRRTVKGKYGIGYLPVMMHK